MIAARRNMAKTRRRFGAVRQLPSGRWQARYAGPEGEFHRAPRTFATKTEAGQYLAGVEADLSRGQWRIPAEVTTTVTEWGDRFLAAQSPRLAVKTVALYSSLFTSCITPTFGNSALPTIRKIDVREWVAGLSARPLSPSRVRQAHGLLSQILASAVDDDLLKSNPCTGVRTPRLPVTEPRILTPDDVARLAAAIRPPFGLLVELLAYGGLRIGEAFALRRRSLDELHKRLMIEESLSETGGRLTFGPTKTHQARAIALPDFLVDDLLRHLSNLKAPEADALLFTGRTGRPLHYNAFRTSIWDPAALQAGLDKVTPHALRATCATWVADSAGVLEAAKRLGHARTSVTTRHYARPVEGRDRDVADRLSAMRPTTAPDEVARGSIWHADGTTGHS